MQTQVDNQLWSNFWLFFLLPIIGLNLHYFMNLVHLSSHFLLSPNKKINHCLGFLSAIPCGLTISDFSATHILHHGFLHTDRDPDKYLVRPHPLLTPFLIWKHDWFFWSWGLWKKNYAWCSYLINRLLQVILIFSLIMLLENGLDLWIYFWLWPLLLVGLGNSLFLFYFPHYQNSWEQKIRQRLQRIKKYKINQSKSFQGWKSNSSQKFQQNLILEKVFSNIFLDKVIIWVIDISRVYHQKHHDQIQNNWNYFPLISFLKDCGQWQNLCTSEFSNLDSLQSIGKNNN